MIHLLIHDMTEKTQVSLGYASVRIQHTCGINNPEECDKVTWITGHTGTPWVQLTRWKPPPHPSGYLPLNSLHEQYKSSLQVNNHG